MSKRLLQLSASALFLLLAACATDSSGTGTDDDGHNDDGHSDDTAGDTVGNDVNGNGTTGNGNGTTGNGTGGSGAGTTGAGASGAGTSTGGTGTGGFGTGAGTGTGGAGAGSTTCMSCTDFLMACQNGCDGEAVMAQMCNDSQPLARKLADCVCLQCESICKATCTAEGVDEAGCGTCIQQAAPGSCDADRQLCTNDI